LGMFLSIEHGRRNHRYGEIMGFLSE